MRCTINKKFSYCRDSAGPMASLGSDWTRGRTAPGDTLQGRRGDTRLKLIYSVAEFSGYFSKFNHNKIKFSWVSPCGGCRQLKNSILQRWTVVTKKRKKVVSFFGRKNRVTPSVAAPGDTNLSDATVLAGSLS